MGASVNVTYEVKEIIDHTLNYAIKQKHEYITPEHLLYFISFNKLFRKAFTNCGGNIEILRTDLNKFFIENVAEIKDGDPKSTIGFENILNKASNIAANSGKDVIELPHLIKCILDLEESYASYFIAAQNVDGTNLMYELCSNQEESVFLKEENPDKEQEQLKTGIRFAECLNDSVENENPLIGRERELERTIQILCRKDKNNALHIGEPGVGKTAITYGLARILEADQNKKKENHKIPDLLKGARIYSIDIGTMLAGTGYRGDFEKRFQEVMEEISKEEKSIVYIDEIHNIVGAGAVNGGSFDAANMLKPYLTEGKIRFIGATTYEEYKKYFSKSKSLVRRFQNIEVKEPTKEETYLILKGLKKHYEKFHGVKYLKGVLEYAVELSSLYMTERYLPDKAIDLMDEAGAYRTIHKLPQKVQTIGKDLIDHVISKICNIPKQVIEIDEVVKLKYLDKQLSAGIFGQDMAIEQVTNAIKFSKAGLLEEGKPLASLLFVGSTGVGKTEVAKVLAKELGIPFIRFDMSEYAEKHAVAKLIGSPAGYVGYEEGGLLTEEIRKNPHAVLLLDEIEKAHGDIYNILLQVMDYATLTDNQGRKADFRNIILIMTSNAGADKLGKNSMGFIERDVTSDVIMEDVKRIFQPEFRNRLSKIVVFNQINKEMARLIAEKKLKGLANQLSVKNVHLTVSEEAVDYLKDKGISREYGAREIDRVINSEIKNLLVNELLFGKLSKGGNCHLDYKEGCFVISLNY